MKQERKLEKSQERGRELSGPEKRWQVPKEDETPAKERVCCVEQAGRGSQSQRAQSSVVSISYV